jgi:tetratricopeptide (TPR) repeat protein
MKLSPRPRSREAVPPRVPAAAAPISLTLSHAIEHLKAERLPEALELLRSLHERDLDAAQSALLGLIYLSVEADRDALTWFDRALCAAPKPQGVLAHRALALQRLGRQQEALQSYDQALAADDLDASGFYHRGNLLRETGRLDEAIASYDAALRLNPAYPEALYAGGTILLGAGQLEASLEFFDEALRLKPDFCQAWFSRGNALQKLNRCHAAIGAYDAALGLAPGHPDVLTNRGVAFYEIGRHSEALASYEEALRARPDFPQALLNRANVYLRIGKPDLALVDCEAALKHKPDYLEALSSEGIALRDLGRIRESITSFDTALAFAPGFAHARNNRGAALLLLGDFERGWEDYEFRWIGGETPKRELKLPLPEWSGEVKPGEHILAFDEQGFGDAIQFSRYLPPLIKAGAKVTFFCRKKLHRLLGTLDPAISLVDTISAAEEFDCQVALSSFPFILKTGLETIPAATPYIFAEAERVAQWKHRLGPEGFKIGLCWHGNQNVRADPARSIPLAAFAALAAEGVRLIGLQVGAGTEQLDDLPPSMRVERLGDDFDAGPDAFLDTAAVMQGLDLIVTCDTSVAHLAGALGRPVWLLLKPVPDWRWLLDRADSPWYPTMRLFRRTGTESWADLLARVAFALHEHLEYRAT